MSQFLFPSSLPGLDIKVHREAAYAVRVQETLSRKEQRFTYETYPRTRWLVDFNILRSSSVIATRAREWQQLFAHLARSFGRLDSFLLADPDDAGVIDHGFAVGDGATTTFQLQRTLAGDVIDAAGFSYHAQSKPYVNNAFNGSFETDSNADGLADSWTVYNNSPTTEPTVARIVPGMNGGKAQRVSWGANNTTQKGITKSSAGPAWVAGQWNTLSWYARATGSVVGTTMGLGWNTAPSSALTIANPGLTGAWQRYVFQFIWNFGVTPEALGALFVTILTGAAVFGDLDIDLLQVTPGQWAAVDLQPIETPAAATGTRTPAYWPAVTDGFEPIFDLSAAPTLYQDGDWRGRRTIYPWTRTNQATFSEAQDNAAWTKTHFTVTADTVAAPDGTTTADKLVEDAVATVEHYSEQGISALAAGALAAFSVYVKPAGRSWLYLGCVQRDNATVVGSFFNVTTGTLGTPNGGVTAAIVDAGNGWFRCAITANVGIGGTAPRIRIKNSTGDGVGTHTGDGASGLYVWGAQVEIVSSIGPTGYIKTPSSSAVTVTDYALSASGVVTPSPVLPAGAYLSADMSYYRRVRFEEDQLGADRLGLAMWETKGCALISVKP